MRVKKNKGIRPNEGTLENYYIRTTLLIKPKDAVIQHFAMCPGWIPGPTAHVILIFTSAFTAADISKAKTLGETMTLYTLTIPTRTIFLLRKKHL